METNEAPTTDEAYRTLPSGTSLSFAVLIILVLSTAALIYSGFGIVFAHGDRLFTCLRDPSPQSLSQLGIAQLSRITPGLDKCAANFARPAALVIAGGVAGLIGFTLLLFAAQPWWEVRYRRLQPLYSRTPELPAYLHGLVQAAGLSRIPTFFIDPTNGLQSAHVFGGFRHQHVCLNAGLLPLFSTDRPAFRGVVLHELAHLRNRDVPITYLTIAAWRAFVVLALTPLVAGLIYPFDLRNLLSALSDEWRVAALVVMTYLSRNAVLRIRESYADVRAMAWQGSSGHPVPSRPSGIRLPSWALTHPLPEQRAQVMANPRLLYRPSFLSMLTGGAALTLCVRHLADPLVVLLQQHYGVYDALMAVTFEVPLAGLLVVATWRAVAFSQMGGQGSAVTLLPGVGLGVGLVIGYLIDLTPFSTAPGLFSSPETTVGAVALVLGMVLVGMWAACCARARQDRAPLAPLRWPLALATASAAAIIAVYLGWWAHPAWPLVVNLAVQADGWIRPFASGIGWSLSGWTAVAVAYDPLGLLLTLDTSRLYFLSHVIAVLVWLTPLGLVRFRAPYRCIIQGAVTGAVCLMLLGLLLRGGISAFAPPQAHRASVFPVVLSAQEICLALAVQAVVAAAVSAAARPGGTVPGLLAGYLSGAVGIAILDIAFRVPAGAASPLVLAPGVCASAAGLALGAALARIPHAPLRPRLRAPQLVLIGAALPAVAVLVALAGIGSPASTVQPVVRASPSDAIDTWYKKDSLRHIRVYLRAEANAALNEPQLYATHAPPLVMAECSLVDRVADTAAEVPAIPDPEARRLWTQGIVTIHHATAGCVASAMEAAAAPTPNEISKEISTGEDKITSAYIRATELYLISERF